MMASIAQRRPRPVQNVMVSCLQVNTRLGYYYYYYYYTIQNTHGQFTALTRTA